MAIREDGKWALGTVWTLTTLVLLLVILRIRNRIVLAHSFGLDDITFMIGFALLLLVSILLILSSYYGFGQSNAPNNSDSAKALFYEAIGINVVGTGIAVARSSFGLFLLRIFQERRHQVMIWGMLCILFTASAVSLVLFWTECTPVPYLWDNRIKGGYCRNRFLPSAYGVTFACILADFFFAIFPCMVVWKTNMNRHDKIIVLSSLSLGIIAGVLGIVRSTTIDGYGLSNPAVLKTSVPVAILGISELAVALMCSGIPVCLPFFIHLHTKWGRRHESGSPGQSREGEVQLNSEPSSHSSTLRDMARKFGVSWTGIESRHDFGSNDDEVELRSGEDHGLNDAYLELERRHS